MKPSMGACSKGPSCSHKAMGPPPPLARGYASCLLLQITPTALPGTQARVVV
jgi:hypothetical protein